LLRGVIIWPYTNTLSNSLSLSPVFKLVDHYL
jgi:hypothetical protein